jgi:hypothetical protein
MLCVALCYFSQLPEQQTQQSPVNNWSSKAGFQHTSFITITKYYGICPVHGLTSSITSSAAADPIPTPGTSA